MHKQKFFLSSGALFALLAVACGAFGAHALETRLAEAGNTGVWDTAVRYQMWHALALLTLGAMGAGSNNTVTAPAATGVLFCAGILLFSGSLYLLALGGPGWLGPVTPVGGLCFLAGWALLLADSLRSRA
ncbi:MAG: DUF423 domain-containing protein [Opitutales bacterium]